MIRKEFGTQSPLLISKVSDKNLRNIAVCVTSQSSPVRSRQQPHTFRPVPVLRRTNAPDRAITYTAKNKD